MKLGSLALAVCLTATGASAQSFNIDVGSLVPGGAGAGLPAPVYGAAAHLPGVWNSVGGLGLGPFPLVDLSGAATPVVCTRSDGLGSFFGWNNSLTTGYCASLMEDAHNTAVGGGTTVTYTFSGLEQGTYVVFTYAWSPLSAADRTDVLVAGSTSANPQTVGGAMPALNTFALGVTHAVHVVGVVAGSPLVVTCSTAVNAGTINGFQICRGFGFEVKQSAPGGSVFFVDSCGTPGAYYANLIAVTQGAFPNGPLFGLDLSIADALVEVAYGPPFFGVLDGNGYASTAVASPPFAAGTTFYCVGVQLGHDLAILDVTAPFTFTLQ